MSVQIDVSSSESVAKAAEEIRSRMPRVPDVVVNSAGITRDAYMLKMTEENYDAVLGVNLKGTWNVCKTFSQMMVDAKVRSTTAQPCDVSNCNSVAIPLVDPG